MGGMKFKQRGREEQAEADGTEVRLNFHPCHNFLIFTIPDNVLYYIGRRPSC